MQIVFRVDASATIGTGHFMRCLTLAEELKRAGASSAFVTRHLPDHLNSMATSRGYQVFQIGNKEATEPCDELAHAHFLGTSQRQDVAQTREILSKRQTTWLVVDHYGIDQRWESSLRPFADRILIIDDLADRQHDCDLLVDQNAYADMSTRYDGRIPRNAKALLGPSYAILRPEFRIARKKARIRKGKPKHIFVFFGGMDSSNYTSPVLRSIRTLALSEIQVDVVIGTTHPARAEIQRICDQSGYACHVQTEEMAQLLLRADLAIGAGGATSWERCCLGLPSLAYAVASNQEALTRHADHLGLLKAGTAHPHEQEALSAEIKGFIHAHEMREGLSRTCMTSVDGKGNQRILAHMQPTEFRLRDAKPEDAQLLFKWRNHPSIRQVSINSTPINWHDHERWFRNAMEDPNRKIYIAEQAKQAVGVIRFDINQSVAEVSLYLAPGQTGKGFGTRLLKSGEQHLRIQHREIKKLEAKVIESNCASHRLFERCGYQFSESLYTKTIQE